MIRLVGVGDNTVDTYVNLRMLFPGGNAVNVAVLAHQLGAETGYVGWLGDDECGELILAALKAEGVDISHCRVFPGKATSFSSVELVDGDRVFGTSNHGVSKDFILDKEDLRYIQDFDIVHTSVYSHVEDQLPHLKKFSARLSFDLSNNVNLAYLERVLPFCDYAFVSLSDVQVEERVNLIERMHALGPKMIIATCGKEGSWVFDGQQLYHQSITPVTVVDTLGAGDAYAACFLVEITAGTTIPLAMERSAKNAAKNCLHYGAFGYGKKY